ncbi:Alkaline phosphatase synthesis transcriptional regulatory protein PhoP [Planctomycetes bacterium K23_9]|uniref:Alkaline phosphatase synthesis transcriptional regulatory protein PhoP n=2 Tax=Stieleria marina TaxID=1930275 RepID=A0A517NM00_9BACT|nr:Alkaline phosphatase synthesis transcriptional regulatory protein PhoP [Planctomycetes bacterium K23_9]
MKILVADDSHTICTLLRRCLTGAGYDVILAHDGKQAVELAKSELPDLVILDIQMPEMDGYAACEKILAINQQRERLPIIFLTKRDGEHLATLGSEMGAYLQKPVCEETLLSTVRALLSRSSTTSV